MLSSLLLIPPLMKLAVKLDFVDTPDERKVHTGAIPRIGGLAMIIGTLIAVLVFLKIDQHTLAFIIAILCLAVFGMWDDRMQLGYRIKFIGQLLASFIVIFYADVKIDSMPFLYDGIIPDLYAIPFTLFVLLGAMNAINLSDGLDGLAGGGALLSLGVIAVMGYQAGDIEFVMLTLAVMGSVFGFLRFNTHPAVIFMGDTGSQFLGFAIGVLATILIQEVNPILSPSIAMVILGLPILDTFSVICTRLLNGRSAFKPDKNHVHHKLLNLGLEHYEVVFIIYLIQSVMVLCAYFFRYYEDYAILFYYVLFGLLLNIFLHYYKPHQFQLSKQHKGTGIRYLLARINDKRNIYRNITSIALLIMMFAFFIWMAYVVANIPNGLFVIAAIVFFVIMTGLFVNYVKNTELIARISLYILSTCSIYLIYNDAELLYTHRENLNIFFLIIAAFVGIGFMLPDKEKISVTPLDYIIIFVVVSFTVFASSLEQGVVSFASIVAWLFVLFYAAEYLVISIRQHRYVIKAMLLLSLGVLLLRAVG